MSFPYLPFVFQTRATVLLLKNADPSDDVNLTASVYNKRHVLCVVSRLQGDSLSDNRSEEDRRPHISEQAVPDISCRFAQHGSNSAALYIVVLGFFLKHFGGLTRRLLLSSSSCLCVMCGSAPLSGLDTVAAQLQECEALSQVSTSVSILPTFVIIQLRSLYSRQLQRRSPPQPLLSRRRAGKGRVGGGEKAPQATF